MVIHVSGRKDGQSVVWLPDRHGWMFEGAASQAP